MCVTLSNTFLQDPANLELEPWHCAQWILQELDVRQLTDVLASHGIRGARDKAECIRRLRESKRARASLRQAAIAVALLAVTLRLQLIVLGRLPVDQLFQPADTTSTRAEPMATSGVPLYSIDRFGTAAEAAARPCKRQKTGAGPAAAPYACASCTVRAARSVASHPTIPCVTPCAAWSLALDARHRRDQHWLSTVAWLMSCFIFVIFTACRSCEEGAWKVPKMHAPATVETCDP